MMGTGTFFASKTEQPIFYSWLLEDRGIIPRRIPVRHRSAEEWESVLCSRLRNRPEHPGHEIPGEIPFLPRLLPKDDRVASY